MAGIEGLAIVDAKPPRKKPQTDDCSSAPSKYLVTFWDDILYVFSLTVR